MFAWCLFEKHFKSIKEFYSMEEEKSLFQNAELVIKLVNQNSKSPYEHVVFRIIKLLKDKPQYPASRILYWLNKIDVKLISDTPYTFTGKYGKEQESQSRKEMYYACKTKALFEKKLYSDCIICCDEAISQITLFHHDNDIWINIRKAKSIGFNGDIQTALNNLLDLQIKKDHWSLLEDISLFYYKSGDFKNCLIYALRAALTKDPIYQKVNLFYHIGLILQKNGDNDHALMHYLFSKKIREEKDWALPDSLRSCINTLSQDVNVDSPVFKTMQDFWIVELKKLMGSYAGKINSLLGKGNVGFITCGEKSIFFKASSILNNRIVKQGDKVNFCIVESFDKKKDIKTLEAAYIELINI